MMTMEMGYNKSLSIMLLSIYLQKAHIFIHIFIVFLYIFLYIFFSPCIHIFIFTFCFVLMLF